MSEHELRLLVRAGCVAQLTDEELVGLARVAKEPVYPSACVSWAEHLAVPLLHELAYRFGENHDSTN